jgi:hypothetical protein
VTRVFPLLSRINNMISKFKTPLTAHQWKRVIITRMTSKDGS